jgi:hypothetical protein
MPEALDRIAFYHGDTHDTRSANERRRFATIPWLTGDEDSINVEATKLFDVNL